MCSILTKETAYRKISVRVFFGHLIEHIKTSIRRNILSLDNYLPRCNVLNINGYPVIGQFSLSKSSLKLEVSLITTSRFRRTENIVYIHRNTLTLFLSGHSITIYIC